MQHQLAANPGATAPVVLDATARVQVPNRRTTAVGGTYLTAAATHAGALRSARCFALIHAHAPRDTAWGTDASA